MTCKIDSVGWHIVSACLRPNNAVYTVQIWLFVVDPRFASGVGPRSNHTLKNSSAILSGKQTTARLNDKANRHIRNHWRSWLARIPDFHDKGLTKKYVGIGKLVVAANEGQSRGRRVVSFRGIRAVVEFVQIVDAITVEVPRRASGSLRETTKLSQFPLVIQSVPVRISKGNPAVGDGHTWILQRAIHYQGICGGDGRD